jgi:hypothetical protein
VPKAFEDGINAISFAPYIRAWRTTGCEAMGFCKHLNEATISPLGSIRECGNTAFHLDCRVAGPAPTDMANSHNPKPASILGTPSLYRGPWASGKARHEPDQIATIVQYLIIDWSTLDGI